MTLQIENLTIPIWIYDIENHCIFWANQPGLALWESDSLDELCSRDFSADMSEALQESLLEYQESFRRGETLFHNWHFSPKGIDKQAYCHFSGYEFRDGRIGMLVEALPLHSPNGEAPFGPSTMLSDYSEEGVFISGNPSFLQEIGRNVRTLHDIIVDFSALKMVHRQLAECGQFESDVLINSVKGDRWYRLMAAHVEGSAQKRKILLHQYDIHHRKTSEIALTREVFSDALTGLLNRRGLDQRLTELHAQKEPFVLYYIDIDGFKMVNDSYGHGVGDNVLQTIAERLRECVRDVSSICRIGGDEFVIIVPLNNMAENKEYLANSMITALSRSYDSYPSNAVTLSASIGVAQYPIDADNIVSVVLYADAAMYQAKHFGKRRWIQYTAGMEEVMLRKSIISQYLYHAKDKNELSVYYQPIWDFTDNPDGCIVSFEALLRWHNSKLGWVPPEEAVRVAEEIGVINDIGYWVARQALTDLVVLRQHVAPLATMAVNISAIQLHEPKTVDLFSQLLVERNLKPSDLVIELTESALIDDIDKGNNAVRNLCDLGINISVDDFGTGYSSLAYLHCIPVNTIKIDQSFVAHLDHNSHTVRNIRQLIESYHMRALIEGVETEDQKHTLLEFGIHLQQGFLLGRPKPLEFYLLGDDELIEK